MQQDPLNIVAIRCLAGAEGTPGPANLHAQILVWPGWHRVYICMHLALRDCRPLEKADSCCTCLTRGHAAHIARAESDGPVSLHADTSLSRALHTMVRRVL